MWNKNLINWYIIFNSKEKLEKKKEVKMANKSVEFTLERETKNKVRFNDNAEFGPMYVPKSWFADGNIPEKITFEGTW